MNRLYVVGLTGPTGAGKSTVATLFAREGVPVLDADGVARQVTAVGSPVLERLAGVFGRDILNPDGALCRKILAARAFASPQATKRLNEITHPAILSLIRDALSQLEAEGERLAVLDAPQLFESGAQALCGEVIAVLAAPETRLVRIMERDGISKAMAWERIKAQPKDEFYQKANRILRNDGDLPAFERAARQLVEEIKERRI